MKINKNKIPITIARIIIAVIRPIIPVFKVNPEGLLPKAALIVIPIQYMQYFMKFHIFIPPRNH